MKIKSLNVKSCSSVLLKSGNPIFVFGIFFLFFLCFQSELSFAEWQCGNGTIEGIEGCDDWVETASCTAECAIKTGYPCIGNQERGSACDSGICTNRICADPPTVTLSSSDAVITESGGKATFPVRLSEKTANVVIVDVEVASSSTSELNDYVFDDRRVIFLPGETQKFIYVTAIDDAVYESANESVVLEITAVQGATESTQQTAQTEILDNDAIPTAILLSSPHEISDEGGVNTATVIVLLSHATEDFVTVNLGFSGDAIKGTDYKVLGGTKISISPGNTSNSITISAINDSLDEGSEDIIVDILSMTGANETNSASSKTTIVIVDDAQQQQSSVELYVDNGKITEASGIATFTAELNQPTSLPVEVALGIKSNSTASSSDYNISPSTLKKTIPAGSTKATFALTPVKDSINESTAETLTLEIINLTNAIEKGGIQEATTRITDSNTVPSVSLSIGNASTGTTIISENNGSAKVIASIPISQIDHSNNIDVTFAFSGTATPGVDYQILSSSLVNSSVTKTIAAGQSKVEITISASQDLLNESDESIIIDLKSVTNAAQGTPSRVSMTIDDDDGNQLPVLSLTADKSSINESGSVVFTLSLSAKSTQNVTVDLQTSGKAQRGRDFTLNATRLTIPAGNLSAQFILSALKDGITESNEDATITIANVQNATTQGTLQKTIIITDGSAVVGSSCGSLISPSYVQWNTFLKMYNFLELELQGSDEVVDIDVTIYNADNEVLSKTARTINGNNGYKHKVDISIHDEVQKACNANIAACGNLKDIDKSGIVDSQGLVRLDFDCKNDSSELRGRLSAYSPDGPWGDDTPYVFAFARELRNVENNTTSYGMANTHDPERGSALVPNWTEVSLLSESGTIRFTLRDDNGTVVYTEDKAMKEHQTIHFASGHQFTQPGKYITEVTPLSSDVVFLSSNTRYHTLVNDNGQTIYDPNRQDFVYNSGTMIKSHKGTTEPLYVSVSNVHAFCGRTASFVEVHNNSSSSQRIEVAIRNSKGTLKSVLSADISGHGRWSFEASKHLTSSSRGEVGAAKIISTTSSSITAQSDNYVYDSCLSSDNRKLLTFYTLPARPGSVAEAVQYGSVNTFLKMDNRVVLSSIASTTPSRLPYELYLYNNLQTSRAGDFSLASLGSSDNWLNPNVSALAFNQYGFIRVKSVNANDELMNNQFMGDVLRVKKKLERGRTKIDFIFAVPMQ